MLNYILNHSKDYDKVVATVFKNTEDSNFVRLLAWDGCISSSEKSLEFKPDEIYIKNTYCTDLSKLPIEDEYIIIGCDSDACVIATVFSMFDKGYNFRVLSDFVYTSGNVKDEDILELYNRNFGKAVV